VRPAEEGAREEERGRDEPPAKRARVDGPAPPAKDAEPLDDAHSSSDDGGGEGTASEGSADEDEGDDGPPEETSAKGAHVDSVVGEDAMEVGAGGAAAPVDGEAGSEAPQKRFQVVCHHWRRGNCGLGDDCPYLHEVRPLSLSPSLLSTSTSS